MSGFEIAGVVLASIPLIIKALESYDPVKDSIGIFVSHRIKHEALIQRLDQLQESLFIELKIIFRAARIGESDMNDLQEYIAVLTRAGHQAALETFLGSAFDTICRAFRDCQDTLDTLVHKMSRAIGLPKVSKNVRIVSRFGERTSLATSCTKLRTGQWANFAITTWFSSWHSDQSSYFLAVTI